MSELPKGWVEVEIDAVTDVISGGTPKSVVTEFYSEEHSTSIAWITPADLSGYKAQYISHGRRSITEAGYSSCSAKLMPKGTVLFSSRAPVGYVVIAANEISTNQGFKSFVPSIGVDSKYLYFYLKSIKHLAESLATGTTFKELSGKVAKTLPFPLAPLAEQKRIVEKLDQVLAQVDTIKARLDGIPAIFKRFRQSVLAAAVSGKLTEGWRGNNNLFNSWESHKIGNLVSKIEAGKNIRCIERPPENDEVGIVKISAVTWGVFNEAESKTLSERDLFIENRRIQKGDFLISRANTIELLGNPVIVSSIEKNLMLSDKVLRLVMDSDDKPWLNIFLRSIYGRKEIESRSTGNQMSMRNIGQKALLDIDIPKPIKEEQTEIVRLVNQYFAFADTIEKQVQKAQQRVDKLTQSILAKAFRGELVPQNPDDEPADELLKRIAAARTEAEALAKAAKKVGKKK